jgi:RNA polymerase sigma factor (sigma-70 family)
MADNALPLPAGSTGWIAEPGTGAYARDGFAVLYHDTYDRMWRLAFLLVGDGHVAEEVVQDAFARVLERWASLDEPAAYLRTTVVNRSHDVHRRARLVSRLALVARRETIDATPDPLWDALGHLPAQQRTALVLRFYEDLPVRDVAALMRVREGTVKSLVHRGLERLRREIER